MAQATFPEGVSEEIPDPVREAVKDVIDAILKPMNDLMTGMERKMGTRSVFTAFNTGMRKEEILSLEWDKHIDLRHGFILLDRTKNGDRRGIPLNRTPRGTLPALPTGIDT